MVELNVFPKDDFEKVYNVLYQNTDKFRNHFLQLELNQNIKSIKYGFFKITDKYKIDILRFDIPNNAYYIPTSIGQPNLHLKKLTHSIYIYYPEITDHLFWQNIDYTIFSG